MISPGRLTAPMSGTYEGSGRCWALLALLLGALSSGAVSASPPSILLVVLDDARPETVPWLDEMAEQGVRFEAAYTSQPHCGPSRASLLTGRFAEAPRNGVLTGLDESDTLGTRMQEAGYVTAFIGKYVNGYKDDHVPHGWDRWLAFSGTPHYYGYVLVDETGAQRTPAGYSADYLAAELDDFLTHAGAPAFALWAPFAPHVDTAAGYLPVPAPRHVDALAGLAPHRPPNYEISDGKPFYLTSAPSGNSDLVRRRGMEATLAIQEALEGLRADFPELIVFVTSDNGAAWGEFGWHSQKKNCPHLHCIQVPLAAFGPWPPRFVEEPVTLEDLTATSLALAGADASGLDGSSFENLLEGGTAWGRTTIPLLFWGSVAASGVPRWSGALDTVTGRLTARYTSGETEEYDLLADPWQLDNLGEAGHPTRRRNCGLGFEVVLLAPLLAARRRLRLCMKRA